MKYCSTCGTPLEKKIPVGDNRERSCCPGCGAVHYINPKIVVGTIPTYQGKVLLCKRAIEPRYGFWTLPALGPLFTMFDVIRAEQVHIFFRAEMSSSTFCAGEESLDVKLFAEEEIPWDELAFKTVSKTLTLFFTDRKAGRYTLHTGDVFDHTDWTDSQFKA